MDINVKRRVSIVYLLQLLGAFMFVFLFLSILLQWRWRRLKNTSPLILSHYKWQVNSMLYFAFGIAVVLLIPDRVLQLYGAYATTILLLGRTGFASLKLRKGLEAPHSLFSRTGE